MIIILKLSVKTNGEGSWQHSSTPINTHNGNLLIVFAIARFDICYLLTFNQLFCYASKLSIPYIFSLFLLQSSVNF